MYVVEEARGEGVLKGTRVRFFFRVCESELWRKGDGGFCLFMFDSGMMHKRLDFETSAGAMVRDGTSEELLVR